MAADQTSQVPNCTLSHSVEGSSNISQVFSISKLITLGLTLLLISSVSYGQKEGNIWYFGDRAGLDFNSGKPVALTNGVLNTTEGCSVISDDMGNLMFYTEGITVWNKNHIRMPNGFGLMGHPSSTQSAVIISKPGSSNIYYIFTTTAAGGANGLRYSIVDMTLEGSLGDVTTKNVPLKTPVTEKLTAVKHANGCDIWIIAHVARSDEFIAYHVDSSGVDTIPVSSKIGTSHSGGTSQLGQLKASPDGSKLALAIFNLHLLELFDFDNTTGIVSNSLSFPPIYPVQPGSSIQPGITYGLEFSPDGTKLYLGIERVPEIYQYDLMAGSSTDIINSVTLIGTPGTLDLGQLQLGPDGKIYCARWLEQDLGVINNPNAQGMACNYVDRGVFLGGRLSLLGLPTFMQSHFYAQFTYENPCAGDSTLFLVTDTANVDSVHWTFGDTSSGVLNTSTDLNPYHVFNTPGRYNVQMISYGPCTSVFSRTVIIYTAPQINLGNDTLICPDVSLTLNADYTASTYLWQDNSTNSNIAASSPGIYWVNVSNACGSDIDSINIEHFSFPEVNLGNDTILCPGQSLILDATIPGASYNWQNDSTDAVYTVSASGLYWVEVISAEGCTQSDSIVISYSALPDAELGNDTLLCQGEELLLDVTNPGATYQWQDNSTTSSYTVTDPGFYWVEVTNADGCSNSDSVTIDFSIPPVVSLGNDTVFCEGQSYDLILNIPGVTYEWQNDSTDSIFTVSSSGLYWVEATNADGCSNSDSVDIKITNLKADFSYEEIPCTDQIQFINLSSDTLSSHWDFGDGTTSNENNPVHVYKINEKFTVTLIINTDSICIDTAQLIIPFEDDAAADTLFIPNIFTPNGDGNNDYFEITGGDTPCNFNRLIIFNRWGKKVFESEGNELKWDGTKNGANLGNGIYFYVLEGKDFKKPGSFTLLR